jgi:hypothetical protein
MRALNPPLLPVEGNQAHNYAMFIGLNPSTADETRDDPTIRRCIGFAKKWGYGALCMTNLFAWRATKPADMRRQIDPVGVDNDRWLKECAMGAGIVIAAWGTNGSHENRAGHVMHEITNLRCLRKNADGSPMHPLYVAADTVPIAFW